MSGIDGIGFVRGEPAMGKTQARSGEARPAEQRITDEMIFRGADDIRPAPFSKGHGVTEAMGPAAFSNRQAVTEAVLPADPSKAHGVTEAMLPVAFANPQAVTEAAAVSAAKNLFRAKFLGKISDDVLRQLWGPLWVPKAESSGDRIEMARPFISSSDVSADAPYSDSYFILEGLHSLGDTDTARGVVENLLDEMENYGIIPQANRRSALGESAPPVLSSLVMKVYEENRDPRWLDRAYGLVEKEYSAVWSDPYFKATPVGLARYTDVDYSAEGTLRESGGVKNEHRFGGAPGDAVPVDLNINLWKYETDMARMCRVLGDDAARKGDGEARSEWLAKESAWDGKARERKEKIIDLCWNREDGLFHDYNFRKGRQRATKSLAGYAALWAGMLDTSNPREKAMARRMVSGLSAFMHSASGLPSFYAKADGAKSRSPWRKSLTDPSDISMIAEGLRRYGFDQKASLLEKSLLGVLESSRSTEGVLCRYYDAATGKAAKLTGMENEKIVAKTLGLYTRLASSEATGTRSENPAIDITSEISPGGLAKLFMIASAICGEGKPPEVEPRSAGAVDGILESLHSSLLKPSVLREVSRRGCFEEVYGLAMNARGEGTIFSPADSASGKTKALREGGTALPHRTGKEIAVEQGESVLLSGRGSTLRLGGWTIRPSIGEVAVKGAAPGVIVLSAKGKQLPVVDMGDRIIIGSRLYTKDELPVGADGTLSLPADIFRWFHVAGGNPSLEAFYDASRSWIPKESGDSSGIEAASLPRPEFKKIYDKISGNWKSLTIQPSVRARDSQMQFFNPAIVPGLGIFQTQFNWDSLFASYGLMAQGKHEMVRGMADNLLYLLKTQGLVPNAARSIYMNKSQPPILPAMIRLCKDSVRSEHGDRACREWLKEAYRSLCDDYSRFWNEDGRRGVSEVDGEPVRLSRFYGENHDVAMDESGHDTSYRFKERALDVLPADLNSFLWRNAKDLAGIARDLADSAASTGDSREAQRLRGDAEKWEAEAARRKSDVLKLLWDDKGGLFRDYIFQGEGKGRICDVDCLAAAYAPLWVGMLDPSIPAERRMMDRLVENLPIFERRFGLAATGSDYGHPEMQWNSPSGWAPLHLMVVQGLVENGYYDDATRIAAKWLDLVALNDRTRGVILERYNVETGGLPPVQKGRYETTQGEGPGFGWTNSSFASMLVNVVGGIRVSSGAITLSPHVPPDTFGKDYEFSYKDIPEYGDWGVKFNYDGRSGAFRMRVAGSFTGRPPTLRIITPPLPPGSPPALTDESGKKIQAQMKEIPYKGNLVRYEVSLRNEEGRRELTLGTA